MAKRRPKYETARDRARERAVLDVLAEKWICEYRVADDFASYDAMLFRDGVLRGLVEIKCREMAMATYPTLHISKAKIDKLIATCTGLNLKPLLVVSLWDRILGLTLDPDGYPVENGGRTDRGDPKDLEPVYAIPWPAFKLVATKGGKAP
jgi:hypothetical protein